MLPLVIVFQKKLGYSIKKKEEKKEKKKRERKREKKCPTQK
jgi:hypothetical protein